MPCLAGHATLEEIRERRRRFFTRQMQDSILVCFPVKVDREDEWAAFDRKWRKYPLSEERPFPSNEEIYENRLIHYNSPWCHEGLVSRSSVSFEEKEIARNPWDMVVTVKPRLVVRKSC